MEPEQAHPHFDNMLRKLQEMPDSPWQFLCAAAMMEYLAKMAVGEGKSSYIQFIKQYMPDKYKTFSFQSGDTDLPEQLYYVLRCGIVHSFSLTPDQKRYKEGRKESIVIAHSGDHLTKYESCDTHFTDAVVLVFECFVKDIESALEKVFEKAKTDENIESRMKAHLESNPPIKGLVPTGASHTISPSACSLPASTYSLAVSGSPHL